MFRLPLFISRVPESPRMEKRYRTLPRVRIEVVHDEESPFYMTPVRGPADIFKMLGTEARTWDRERFLSVLVDGRHKVIGIDEVSTGTLTASLVHPREIFKAAILANAGAIVLVHNHPSGDPTPSAEDREITARLKQVAEIVGIPILDHVVLGEVRFYSFAEQEPAWKR
jgi:DNA repair protein RadC